MYDDQLPRFAPKGASTNPRLNEIPREARDYGLLDYVIPGSLNFVPGKDDFAGLALQRGWTKAQAADEWDKNCRKAIADADDAIEAAQVARDNQIGSDIVMTPTEAEAERNRIMRDKAHPFHNASDPENPAAAAYVHRLGEIKLGLKSDCGGYLNETLKERRENHKANYGNRSSAHGDVNQSTREDVPQDPGIGHGEQEVKSAAGKGISDIDEGEGNEDNS